jgi:hypothetical protein
LQQPGQDSTIFGAEDLGKGLTPELRAPEQRLRAEIERQRKS